MIKIKFISKSTNLYLLIEDKNKKSTDCNQYNEYPKCNKDCKATKKALKDEAPKKTATKEETTRKKMPKKVAINGTTKGQQGKRAVTYKTY